MVTALGQSFNRATFYYIMTFLKDFISQCVLSILGLGSERHMGIDFSLNEETFVLLLRGGVTLGVGL